jgi:uncharacterized protein VirK/YbjX
LENAIHTEVQLASFDEEFAGLRLVLDKPVSFLIREGEVVLNLFLEDQRFYSVAFTLGTEEGKLVAYVGAIQGTKDKELWARVRDITKALHHMRPRDLLVVSLQLLCQELGVSKLCAISDNSRHHRSAYFRDSQRAKLLTDYDQLWSEHGGIRRDDGFFELPIPYTHRDIAEIPSRKRAEYRRRYQMLNRLASDVSAICRRYEGGREAGDS